MVHLWSAVNNAFFPDVLLPEYISAGWDVSDCVEIEQTIVDEFLYHGERVRIVVDGMPAWADTPDEVIEPEE